MKKVSDVTAFFESCVIVLILASATWKGAESIKINALRVPDILKNGTGKPAVLDCDYSLEDSKPNNGLVIKWFFNKHPAPVYQWIPNQRPQDLGVLKGKLNLDYHASNDTIKKHRALEIINPTIELSGEYECFVSTFAEETSQSKKMIIYVPEKNLALNYTKPKEDAVTFTCAADGVYPEPNMTIVASDSTHSGRTEVNTTSRDGLFDIVAAITIEDRDLESPTTFVCELRIPEANYTVKTSTTYFPGPPTTTTAPPSSQTAIDADLLATGSATSLKLSFWMLAFAISLNYLRL